MSMYSGVATATGGRSGHVESSDGLLKFDLSTPRSMGGPGREGTTNPEQLFACGYAACFGSALDFVAKQKKLDASGAEVTCQVDIDRNEGGFFLAAELTVTLPNLDRAAAEELVAAAHEVCPYSKATRGNMDVTISVA
jgi:lipoyl-dependent peroxiredoxin